MQMPFASSVASLPADAFGEARTNHLTVKNESRLDDELLYAIVSKVGKQKIISDAALDGAILRLSDLPGVSANAVVSPGTEVGTSDLKFVVRSTKRVSGTFHTDNYGGPYTGRIRGGIDLTVNNPIGIGDQFPVAALTSGSKLAYGRLDGDGTAKITSGSSEQTLIRGRRLNLGARLEFANKRLKDNIATTGIRHRVVPA